MKNMMESIDDDLMEEFKHVFNSKITYNINVNKANLTILPKSINIEGW